MTNSAKLYQKFLAVQQQLKPLEKSGKNDFHKYTYTTASDVLEPGASRFCINRTLFASSFRE
jgi:ERF superfamily